MALGRRMNVVFHVVVGGAIAHVFSRTLHGDATSKPSALTVLGAACAGMASHGLLDWLRHGYPILSILDGVLPFALSGAWLGTVRSGLRSMFALALAASFAPDLIDHLPRLLDRALHLQLGPSLPGPLFPWHSPTWSG